MTHEALYAMTNVTGTNIYFTAVTAAVVVVCAFFRSCSQ